MKISMENLDSSTIVLLIAIYILGCYLAKRIANQVFYDTSKTFINLIINILCILSSWLLVFVMIILYYIYENKSSE